MDNVLLLGISVANGFFDGFGQSLWPARPWWFVLFTRVVIYGYLCFQFGCIQLIVGKLYSLKMPVRATASVSPPARPAKASVASRTTPAMGPSSAVSDSEPAGSDYDESLCAGSLVSMCLETRLLSLSRCECSDMKRGDIGLMSEDFAASHSPQVYEDHGLPLCKMQADIYQSHRGCMMCVAKGCRSVGSTGPGNKYYCSKRFSSSITPKAEFPKVKFAAVASLPETEQDSPSGIKDMSDELILSLVGKMGKRGVADGQHSQNLTGRYGGSLIENALRSHALLEEASFKATHAKLGNIDLVTKQDAPRPAPAPHHTGDRSVERQKAYNFDSDPSVIQAVPAVVKVPPVVGNGAPPNRPASVPLAPTMVKGRVISSHGQNPGVPLIGRGLVPPGLPGFPAVDPLFTAGHRPDSASPVLGGVAVNLSGAPLPLSSPIPGWQVPAWVRASCCVLWYTTWTGWPTRRWR